MELTGETHGLFLGELEREGKATRKVLEQVPEGKNVGSCMSGR